MTSTRLWVVLPVYRDVQSFDRVRREVLECSGEVAAIDAVRFVVVDDTAGVDPEVDRIVGLDDVTVVTPQFSLGHQRAIVVGVRAIADRVGDDDIVVTMDSDGEDRPIDVPRLLDAVLNGPDRSTVVLARRTSRQESTAFKLFYRLFRACFRLLTGLAVNTGNFAAYRGWYAQRWLFHPSFDLGYSASLVALHPDAVLVPCPRATRYFGRSRMDTRRLISHGMSMLMPLADRMAIRMLAVTIAASAASVVFAVLLLTDLVTVGRWGPWIVAFGLVVSAFALIGFLILFAGFVRTNALSLQRVDEGVRIDERPA